MSTAAGLVKEWQLADRNALQVLFLEDKFCLDFLRTLGRQSNTNLEAHIAGQLNSQRLARCNEVNDGEKQYDVEYAVEVKPDEIIFHVTRQFEVKGVDVVVAVSAHSNNFLWDWSWKKNIKIKPTVDDDYPAVMRQMLAKRCNALFLRQYVGKGATREQFIKTFNLAGLRVVFHDEVVGVS